MRAPAPKPRMRPAAMAFEKRARLKAPSATLFRAALFAAALLAASCGRGETGDPVFGPEACRRVAVTDAGSGAALVGAEDLAVDPARGVLYISAYDRRAVEKAEGGNRDAPPPDGGVYRAQITDLFEAGASGIAGDAVKARSLIDPDAVDGGLRPHGVDFDAESATLAFVNRTYQYRDKRWRMTPRLEKFRLEGGEPVAEPSGAVSCAANDVLLDGRRVFTSFDHGACGWRGGIEAAFNLRRSGVTLGGVGPVYAGAAFANGLARTAGGDIVLAATREKALVFLSPRPGGVEARKRVATPGGPDNLSIAHDGAIVAAVHPSMARLALNRKLGIGRAPSRIVKIDPATGVVKLLFDDPSAALFSAATAAVETEAGLIAGSVTDEGLLVCRRGAS